MSPVADLLICLRFFSRVPVPTTAREIALGNRGLASAAAMAPIAGLLIGLGPAAVMLAAAALRLPPSVAAPLAIASLVGITGAIHEDALADCADGFGGGRTREAKLDIMRDSRIGAFGAVAIALSLYLRAAALAAVLARGVGPGIVALLLAAAVSRAVCLVPLVLLPPARAGGLGAATRPARLGLGVALCLALAACVVVAVAGDPWHAATAAAGDPWHAATAAAVAALATLAMCALARRQIGGQTGDVAGAVQQVAEAGILVVFAAMP